MTQLVTWENIDELKPYPWFDTRPYTGFVCMNCGRRTTIEARP